MSATLIPPSRPSNVGVAQAGGALSGSALRRLPVRRSTIVLIGLLAVYLPFYGLYFASHAPFSLPHAAAACGGRPVLDTGWARTAQAAHEYLVACGSAGRAAIVHQQLADLLYAGLYAAVLVAAFGFLLRAAGATARWWRLFLLLPLVTAALDYLENLGIWNLLARYPGSGHLVPHLSTVTQVKLALGYTCLATLAVLTLAAVVVRLRRRRAAR